MRLLVLDRGRLLFELVKRIVPDEVRVAYTACFDRAFEEVQTHKVDAVIAELRHSHLPWAAFQDICCRQTPQIPILFEHSEPPDVDEALLGPLCSCHRFIQEPYHVDKLAASVLELLELTRLAVPGEDVATISVIR
jgi:DNA-binding NtrC family response regulator